MKNYALCIVLTLGLCLAACSPIVSKVNSTTASDVVDNITYAKDKRTGICYALFTTIKLGDYSNTVGITWVPCEKVEKFLN